MRQLISRKSAPHVADIKGLKIRVPGTEAPQVEALGGIPVTITGQEAYTALEKGVIDATFHAWEGAISYKFYEVAKYLTRTEYYPGGIFIAAMNLDKWNSLPDDIKKVFDKYSGRYGAVDVEGKGMWDRTDSDYLSWLKQNVKGGAYYEWTNDDRAKATDLGKVVHTNWISGLQAKGLPAQKIYDETLKLIDKYKK
jgi:TRAP-type C4-dicarboxylate transport system substrate-binding protein